MLIAKTIEAGPPLKIALEGIMDETVDLKTLLAAPGSPIYLYCKNVKQINSVGMKQWINFFKELRASGRKVKFFEISPVLVDARNYSKGFILPEELESLCIPYYCTSCKIVTMNVLTPTQVRELLKSSPEALEEIPCSKCKQPAELEEVADEYFEAIIRG